MQFFGPPFMFLQVIIYSARFWKLGNKRTESSGFGERKMYLFLSLRTKARD